MPQQNCYKWQNEYTHRIHWQVAEQHSHSFWEFVFVTKGVAHHHCNGISGDMHAGQLAFIRPTDSHYYTLDGVLANSLFPEGSGIPYEHRDIYVRIDTLNKAAKYAHCTEVVDHLLKPDYPVTIDLTVLDVSSLIGYDSQSNFINQFKKYTGLTPSAYRSKIKDR